eukprot:15455439-Alexandrium_andersonii.AAC.1
MRTAGSRGSPGALLPAPGDNGSNASVGASDSTSQGTIENGTGQVLLSSSLVAGIVPLVHACYDMGAFRMDAGSLHILGPTRLPAEGGGRERGRERE